LKEGIDLFPNSLTGYHKLGKIYLNVGNYYPAIKTLEQGMLVGNERIPSFLGDLGIAYFKSGQPEKAEQIIEELKSLESKGSQGSPSFFLAQIYAGIGERELAFERLEKSYQAHEVEMIWLKIEPQFNSIRKDPRFSDLLKRVGF
jgi:tetratricopeptide (TPR) repeat protein